MEFARLAQETRKLKIIIYKLVRNKQLNKEEEETIDKIIEEKDYSQINFK